MGTSHYVLPPWPLQEITWIYYISLLVKNLITYWWKTWADRDISQYNNHSSKQYFYQYYLHGCTSEEVLKNHLERFKLLRTQRFKLKEADKKKVRDKIKFTKTEYQLCLPFVIYTDFEGVLPKEDSCQLSSSRSFTIQYQHHVPCGSCIYVKCSDG